MDGFESLLVWLRPWLPALVAGGVALAVALAGRASGRPLLGAVAAGIGVLAGWWFAFGLLTASPRQLPERLPLLMLVLVLAVPVLGAAARRWRWLALPSAVLGAAWVGWWMAGAPLWLPDLGRAVLVLAAVSVGTLLLAFAGAARWAGPVAAVALFAGFLAAPLPGPARVLGAAVCAAAVCAALVRPAKGAPATLAALPLAGALAALAAIPLLARGAAADWAVAAAPLAALLLGAPLGATVVGGRRAAWGAAGGAALAGGLCAGAAFLLG